MKNKILSLLPVDRHVFCEVNDSEIHIIDWKNTDVSQGVRVYSKKQLGINSVCLFNDRKLDISIDAFEENALPLSNGKQASQCDCISFPYNYDDDVWILTIETKYANNFEAAFRIRDDQNYPEKMVSQIVSTVDYFRAKKIIEKEKMVHAIISFPNLVSDFNSTLFSLVKEDWSVENLIVTKKIRIKGCNSVSVISNKRIRFNID